MTDAPSPGRMNMPRFLNDLEGAIAKALPSMRPVPPDEPRSYSAVLGPESNPIKDAIATQSSMQPVQQPKMSDFENAVRYECWSIGKMLLEKNAKYGNSVLSPVRIFSDAHTLEQIYVRIDDKLSRIRAGNFGEAHSSEDTIRDLIGYLVLLLIAENGVT